jgi:DNA-binding response OmpR family regulator
MTEENRKWRVMAVDDDKDILELVRMTLMDDYEVYTFTEPMVAYQSIDTVEPDIAVFDIMMPKMTGYQLVELIKSNKRYEAMPIMFLSAKDTNRDIKYGYKLGAVVYLTKPFQPDRLLRNIDSILRSDPPVARRKKYDKQQLEQLMLGNELGLEGSIKKDLADEISEGLVAAKEQREAKKKKGEGEEQQQPSSPSWLD